MRVKIIDQTIWYNAEVAIEKEEQIIEITMISKVNYTINGVKFSVDVRQKDRGGKVSRELDGKNIIARYQTQNPRRVTDIIEMQGGALTPTTHNEVLRTRYNSGKTKVTIKKLCAIVANRLALFQGIDIPRVAADAMNDMDFDSKIGRVIECSDEGEVEEFYRKHLPEWEEVFAK